MFMNLNCTNWLHQQNNFGVFVKPRDVMPDTVQYNGITPKCCLHFPILGDINGVFADYLQLGLITWRSQL